VIWKDKSVPATSMSVAAEQLVGMQNRICSIISKNLRSRLRFNVRDTQLYRIHGVEPLQKNMQSVRGTALTSLLGQFRNNAKVPVILAFILAQSLWHYYESEWTAFQWTTDTIQIMSSLKDGMSEEAELLAYRPYLAVQFDSGNHLNEEYRQGEFIHPYMKIYNLGILLLEIGIGRKLSPQSAEDMCGRLNEECQYATKLAQRPQKRPKDSCQIDTYWLAVKNCLDPKLFDLDAPSVKPDGTHDLQKDVRKRRKILYDSVVWPLEELLDVSGWTAHLDSKDCLMPVVRRAEHVGGPAASIAVRTTNSAANCSAANGWLAELAKAVKDMDSDLSGSTQRNRVQIVLLDTGYDDSSVFLDDGKIRDRLQKLPVWKDFAGSSPCPVDTDGHGNHLLSLVMQIAPNADLHVARVATDSKNLKDSQESVAKVGSNLPPGVTG
jgi:hypothetical protein